MHLDVTTQPAIEPITLTETKLHCKIETDADDLWLTAQITSARQMVEKYIKGKLISQVVTIYYDRCDDVFCRRQITMPTKKLISVTSLTTYDVNNTAAVFSSSNYIVSGNRIALNENINWPSNNREFDCVKVIGVFGYGASESDVPGPLKLAMLELISHWYENRQALFDPMSPAPTLDTAPYQVTALLQAYRTITV